MTVEEIAKAVWPGCDACTTWDARWNRFCPACGRPVTYNAMKELEDRLCVAYWMLDSEGGPTVEEEEDHERS